MRMFQMNRLPNLRSLASTTLPLALIIGVGVTVSIGSAKAEQAKKIQILDPMDTDPIKRASSADIVSGRTQHRRVITMTKQGSKNLDIRSEKHTSELQTLIRISYAVSSF